MCLSHRILRWSRTICGMRLRGFMSSVVTFGDVDWRITFSQVTFCPEALCAGVCDPRKIVFPERRIAVSLPEGIE